jgi:hypothetical protein
MHGIGTSRRAARPSIADTPEREKRHALLTGQCDSRATAMTAATNLRAYLDLESLLNGSPILYEPSRKCIAYRDHDALCK